MGNMLHAHIFKRRQTGEREEVRMKLYYPDGTPCDVEGLEGGGGSTPPVSPWMTVVQKPEVQLSDAQVQIGNQQLTFTVGDSGMALIHASLMLKVSNNSAYAKLELDGSKELASNASSGFNYAHWSVAYPATNSNPRADLHVNGNVPASLPNFASPGLMLVTEPGEHILRWIGWGDFANNAFAKEARLAVMPL